MTMVREQSSPTPNDPLKVAQAKLAESQKRYGAAFAKENNTWMPRWFKSVDAELIQNDAFQKVRSEYLLARGEYLTLVAHNSGIDLASEAERKEEKSLFYARFAMWEKVYAGMVLGLTGVGALATIGVGSIATGLLTSTGVSWLLSKIPLIHFGEDSTEVVEARENLKQKWEVAKREGMTYDEFAKREGDALGTYAKQIKTDRYIKMGAKSFFGFVGFGITGFRSLLGNESAHLGDYLFGDHWGERIFFGDRPIQKILHTIVSAFSYTYEHGYVGAAMAGPIDDIRPDTYDPALNNWGPKHLDAEVIQVLQSLHLPPEAMSMADLNRLESMLKAHIEWSKDALRVYELTMDMHDPTCQIEYARMQVSLHNFQQLLGESRAGGKMFELVKMHDDLIRRGGNKDAINAMITRLMDDRTNYKNLSESMRSMYQGVHDLNKLTEGYIWLDGAPQEARHVFGTRFKYEGHWKFKTFTGRAFYELYRSIMGDPRLEGYGLRVSEGGDGESLSQKHSATGGHSEGAAFDVTPLNGGDSVTEDYAYYNLMKVFENQLMERRSEMIHMYFIKEMAHYYEIMQHSPAGFAKHQNAENMYEYFKRRDIEFADRVKVNYYDQRFEPGGRFAGVKERFIARMMAEYGVSRETASEWLSARIGDTGNTSNTHLHTYVLAGAENFKGWREAWASAIPVSDRGPTTPQLARIN